MPVAPAFFCFGYKCRSITSSCAASNSGSIVFAAACKTTAPCHCPHRHHQKLLLVIAMDDSTVASYLRIMASTSVSSFGLMAAQKYRNHQTPTLPVPNIQNKNCHGRSRPFFQLQTLKYVTLPASKSIQGKITRLCIFPLKYKPVCIASIVHHPRCHAETGKAIKVIDRHPFRLPPYKAKLSQQVRAIVIACNDRQYIPKEVRLFEPLRRC
jgi:hypothetical protein